MSIGSMFKDMIKELQSKKTEFKSIDTLYSSFKPADIMFNMEQGRAAFKKGGKVQAKEEMPKCKPN